MKKISLLVFALLSTAMIMESIRPVEACGTIYILDDGSISPSRANITTADSVAYTFTDDNYGSIVVQRDNIVVDGAGYALQGTQVWNSRGIDLTGRINVTIKNVEIKEFFFGIWLDMSSCNSVYGNNITYNKGGIWLSRSSNNTISRNNIASNMNYNIYLEYSSKNSISRNTITAKGKLWVSPLYYSYFGIYLYYSSSNSIAQNNITKNGHGIELFSSPNNKIPENNIADNAFGVFLWKSPNNTFSRNDIAKNDHGIILTNSSDNIIYHCNFVDDTKQAESHRSTNSWDLGYPSGGNYWSDYENRYPDAEEKDESSIWNTPYIIDDNNKDNYPLINPWTTKEEPLPTRDEEVPLWMQWSLWATAASGILILAATICLLKKRRT